MAKTRWYRDPVRRPRIIVWIMAVLFAVAAVALVGLVATSTRWFCSEICHKVQDDTIRAYEASTHAEISCMACHEPANADPVTFLIAKVKNALEIIPTVSNTFTLPLNKGSALALNGREMGSGQCTQCHSSNRITTPSSGMIIDHKVHADAGIWCTVCHNRIAHNEQASPPQLTDPRGSRNVAHTNFMTMDECFRCHDIEGKIKMVGIGAKAAPGTCSTCHTAGFDLVPTSHKAADWAAKSHGEAAHEADTEYGKGLVEQEELVGEGVPAYLAAPVNPCYTCHIKSQFCDSCHARLKVTVQ